MAAASCLIPIQTLRAGPYFSTASRMYSEQLGHIGRTRKHRRERMFICKRKMTIY